MNTKTGSGDVLQSIYLPQRVTGPGKAPVLLLLHGVGANEEGLIDLVESLDPRFAVFSLRAPLVIGPSSFAWFHVSFTAAGPLHNKEEAESSRRLLKEFIEGLRSRPELDTNQIFLLGFSQGTIMSLSLALTEPQLIKGVVAIAGRTLQEIAAQTQTRRYEKKPAILLLHGRQDGKLPYSHALNTESVLKERNIPVDFRSYEAGHEINRAMLTDLQKWLASQIEA